LLILAHAEEAEKRGGDATPSHTMYIEIVGMYIDMSAGGIYEHLGPLGQAAVQNVPGTRSELYCVRNVLVTPST